MKKILTFCLLLAFIFNAAAQEIVSQPTSRGNFIIGSRIGFSAAQSKVEVVSTTGSIKGDGGTSSQFNLSPGIGYFFANNFAMGISMDWLRTSATNGIDLNGGVSVAQSSNNNNLLFGPFIRYFLPFGDDKAIFFGGTLGFGNSRNQFVDVGVTQSVNNSLLNIGVGPGLTIFSNNGLAIEALVKYNYNRSVSDINVSGVARTSTIWTNAVDFSIGIQYYFDK